MMTRPAARGTVPRLRHTGLRILLRRSAEEAQTLHAEAQWWVPDVIRARQWIWLQEILHVAWDTNSFYRERMAESGPPPLDPARFGRVPPLTREDLAAYAREIGIERWHGLRRTSGGSGGPAVSIPVDREAYGWYMAGTWRGFQWWGVEPGEPVALMLGSSRVPPVYALLARVKDRLINWRRFPVDAGFDDRTPRVLEDIERFHPSLLYGYPSAVHRLVRTIRVRGRRLTARLKAVVLTGEPLYVFQRQAIAETLECPVVEEYGSGELGSVAFECPHGTLHVTAENVFLETVPAESGGERVLATHLRNRVFPLIRYEIGDIGVIDAEACGCGRGLPTLRILGRDRDRLDDGRSRSLARPLVERCLGSLPEALRGSVRMVHPELGVVVLEVERTVGGVASLDRLADTVNEAFDPGWRVEVRPVDRFERLRSGKLPYFVLSAGRIS
ncbi:MAG TPA: hypothetical protein VEP50_12840 [bacterium]|nr:hypothetical protein [bacterium]